MLEVEVHVKKLLTSNNELALQGKNQHENLLLWVPAKNDYYKEKSPWVNESKTLSPKHNQKAK